MYGCKKEHQTVHLFEQFTHGSCSTFPVMETTQNFHPSPNPASGLQLLPPCCSGRGWSIGPFRSSILGIMLSCSSMGGETRNGNLLAQKGPLLGEGSPRIQASLSYYFCRVFPIPQSHPSSGNWVKCCYCVWHHFCLNFLLFLSPAPFTVSILTHAKVFSLFCYKSADKNLFLLPILAKYIFSQGGGTEPFYSSPHPPPTYLSVGRLSVLTPKDKRQTLWFCYFAVELGKKWTFLLNEDTSDVTEKSVVLAINCIFVICHFNCVYIYELFFKVYSSVGVYTKASPAVLCVSKGK